MSLFTLALVAGMLFTGTINTVTKKMQNQSVAPGIDLRPHAFNHPWFQTFVMFVGEACCLIPFFIGRWREQRAKRSAMNIGSINGGSKTGPEPEVFSPIFLLPTLCDLLGTSLAGIALVFIPASVWQMLRGSVIIFGGLASMIFLKKKLTLMNWIGMFVVMLGLGCVGTSSFIGNSGSKLDATALIGIGLTLAGQLAAAVQMVVEEMFLKKKQFPPLQVVGMEGLNGTLLMAFLVMPIMYGIPGADVGSYENYLDAFVQVSNSVPLLILTIGYVVSIAFYNYCGLSVAKHLSTIHRTLIDACRTILVWITGLMFYYFGLPQYGEGWLPGSWLQVIGFVFLLLGTALYNGALKMALDKIRGTKQEPAAEQQPLLDQAAEEK